jgi:hypothetical protein
MKALVLLSLIFTVLETIDDFVHQSAFFIPVPAAFAPVTRFACPDTGTVFTYDVYVQSTMQPNRMIAMEQDQYNCRINSDAGGVYDWFGGLGPHLDDTDGAEKKLITDLWPLHAGDSRKASKYALPMKYGEVEYVVVSYGLAHVPAGLYWAYKVRKDYYWEGKLYHTTMLWWSTSLKWTILQWPEEPGKPAKAGGFNWKLWSVSPPAHGEPTRQAEHLPHG